MVALVALVAYAQIPLAWFASTSSTLSPRSWLGFAKIRRPRGDEFQQDVALVHGWHGGIYACEFGGRVVLHVGVRHLDSWEFPCDSALINRSLPACCGILNGFRRRQLWIAAGGWGWFLDVSPSTMVNLEMNSTKNKVIPAACACIGLMAGYMDGFKSLVNRWDMSHAETGTFLKYCWCTTLIRQDSTWKFLEMSGVLLEVCLQVQFPVTEDIGPATIAGSPHLRNTRPATLYIGMSTRQAMIFPL